MCKSNKSVKMLGSPNLKKPIWLVVNVSFDNFPDAEEVKESLISKGVDIVVVDTAKIKEVRT